jgi:hypothetical protein
MRNSGKINNVSGHVTTEQDSEAGWRVCFRAQSGGFAGGGAEKPELRNTQ